MRLLGMARPDFGSCISRLVDLLKELGPKVSEFQPERVKGSLVCVTGHQVGELRQLGIVLSGNPNCLFAVRSTTTPVGRIALHNTGDGNFFMFGNTEEPREMAINMRVQGQNCLVAFPQSGGTPIHIPNAYLRSDSQTLYWGVGATSVASRLELEGQGAKIIVGDDCMLSSGVWIRNHDMHTIFDSTTKQVLNDAKPDIVLEQHVWLGFEAFILGAERIGFGSIVGARSLVKDDVPSESLVVGTPARLVRSPVSWCRSAAGIAPATMDRLSRLRRW